MASQPQSGIPVVAVNADIGRIPVGKWVSSGVELTNIGAELREVQIDVGDEWPNTQLRIHLGPALERLLIVGEHNTGVRSSGTLGVLNPHGTSVAIDGKVGFACWALAGGTWEITLPTSELERLELREASVGGAPIGNYLDQVVLSGGAGVGESVRVRHGLLEGVEPVELTSGQWTIDEVSSQVESTRHLVIGNGVHLGTKKLDHIDRVELWGSLAFWGGIRGANELEVSGYGTLDLGTAASVTNVKFESPGTPTRLQLNRNARCLDASGAVSLQKAEKGAVLMGTIGSPVTVTELGVIGHCELNRVDLSGLRLSDLPALQEPSVLDPWMAETRAKSLAVERAEGLYKTQKDSWWRQQLEWLTPASWWRNDDPELRAKLAERWLQISRAVSGRQVSSAMQSRIRYAAHHWRRRSLSWRWGQLREKVLVTGYWAIGYGERILRPLIAFGLLVAVVGYWMDPEMFPNEHGCTATERIEYLLLAPLSVLRVAEAVPPGEHWLIPIIRLVGLLALATALLAGRRIGRAD